MGSPLIDGFIYLLTTGQKILKSPGHKNSWNHINQIQEENFFDQNPIFAISKMSKNSQIKRNRKQEIYLENFYIIQKNLD